ncbi:hypothetical protein GCM10007108_00080 [Thermogymnomonas acidicola]|uniref:DUF488 family protein n=1 Tax=Thermogymnomonas acidicola TaxID=399579 RepID=A0AA37BQ88_9ARCH|nr:DUF488 family protein [Thermogymnomonas acidicola]GGM65776.1 hypothetical protein GCM10007108_00080 [Thermogymnomonas acidicola]
MVRVMVKRVYDAPSEEDGYRVFVERLWPRGMKKDALRMDLWAKSIAPSDALRRWYSHDPARWDEFRKRYREELCHSKELEGLRRMDTVTLLVASRSELNGAVVIKGILENWEEFRSFCRENARRAGLQ